jgi:signal transduction histidine kinase
MIKNIKNTKNELSFLFSIIVFIVILLLGIWFFYAKYFNEHKREEKNFSFLSTLINTWKLDRVKIMWNRFEENFSRKTKIEHKWHIKENLPKMFFNYVHLDKHDNLISKFVRDDVEIEFFREILKEDKYLKLVQGEWFLVKKFNLKNSEKFIILKRLRYDLEDYLTDIFWFIFISIILSIVIYFISRKFIDRIFIPVEQNIEDMKNFIHNAGHELKTPIAVIDSNLQLLDDTKKYDAEMSWEMREEVKKLNLLINSLVNLSEIDSLKNREENNLLEMVNEIIKNFSYKIEDKKIKINIDIDKNTIIKSNKIYLYMFLSNIVWNSIKYNKKDWKIDIYYKNSKLIVKDSWIGISKEDLNKIFDRFYKIDKSRNSEGFGIGLSLVKKIAMVYNWKINMSSNENKGSEFSVEF